MLLEEMSNGVVESRTTSSHAGTILTSPWCDTFSRRTRDRGFGAGRDGAAHATVPRRSPGPRRCAVGAERPFGDCAWFSPGNCRGPARRVGRRRHHDGHGFPPHSRPFSCSISTRVLSGRLVRPRWFALSLRYASPAGASAVCLVLGSGRKSLGGRPATDHPRPDVGLD